MKITLSLPLLSRRLQQSLYFLQDRYVFHIAGIAKSPSDLYSDLKSKLKKTPKGFLFEPVSSKLVSFRRPFRHVYEIFGGKPLIKGNYERERREFWVEKEFFFFFFLLIF